MKKRRVGTLSLGIFLIGLGGLFFYAQFNEKNALEIAATWWPFFLVLLGIEVLWYIYTAKEEAPKVKYDFCSIFIIFLFLIVSMGVYGVSQIGLAPHLQARLATQDFQLQTSPEELVLEKTIKKIVLDVPSSHLRLRVGAEDLVTAFGQAYVTAENLEMAEKLLDSKLMVSHHVGDTLYVSFKQPLNARIADLTLVVPADRALEVKSNRRLEVDVTGLKSQLLIEGSGTTELKVPEQGDYALTAYVDEEHDLQGNVMWTIQEEQEGTSSPLQGQLTFGEGRQKINILSSGTVVVNKI